MRAVIAVALVLSLTGCASVIWQPDDAWYTKTGKTTGRVLMGITTVGVSEIEISSIKRQRRAAELREESRRQQQRYVATLQREIERWERAALNASSEDERKNALYFHGHAVQRLRDYEADYAARRAAAAALAAAFILNRPHQPVQPVPTFGPKVRCKSTIRGNRVNTTCY